MPKSSAACASIKFNSSILLADVLNTDAILPETALMPRMSALIMLRMPLIAHVTVWTIPIHMLFIVAPNPLVAISLEASAATNTAKTATTKPIGLAANTALNTAVAPADANAPTACAACAALRINIPALYAPITAVAVAIAVLIPKNTALTVPVVTAQAFVTAFIVAIAAPCTVIVLVNAAAAMREAIIYVVIPANVAIAGGPMAVNTDPIDCTVCPNNLAAITPALNAPDMPLIATRATAAKP